MLVVWEDHSQELFKDSCHIILFGSLFSSQNVLEAGRKQFSGSEQRLNSDLHLQPLILPHLRFLLWVQRLNCFFDLLEHGLHHLLMRSKNTGMGLLIVGVMKELDDGEPSLDGHWGLIWTQKLCFTKSLRNLWEVRIEMLCHIDRVDPVHQSTRMHV